MLGALSPGRTLLGIPWYSILIVGAIGLAILLCCQEEKRLKLPKDTIIDLALWLIPAGIIGARLYYVAFEWSRFAADPIRIFYIWEGGIAIYGALLGGFCACWLFARRRHLPLAVLADMIMPAVALAQAIGRWGNYFNMEAYGEVITHPGFQFFPFGVLIPEGNGYSWHLATFFYESVWDFGVFSLLWRKRKKAHRSGDIALWYILLYGPGRSFIEGLRMDSLYAADGLRISQWLSLIACFVACTIYFVRGLRSTENKRSKVLLQSTYIISIIAVLALMLSGDTTVPIWVKSLPSLAALFLLWLSVKHDHACFAKITVISLLPITQLLSLCFKANIDPLLFSTLQTAVCGLSFTAVAILLYPATLKY